MAQFVVYLGISPTEYKNLTLAEREILSEVFKEKQAKEREAFRR